MNPERPADQPNPWRALAPLRAGSDEDRRIVQLTRDDDLHILTNLVSATRVSLLYAASGNGKTSLLQAGVVPFFEKQGYIVFTVRPRPPWAPNDPRAAFRSCMTRQLAAAVSQAFDRRSLDEIEKLVAGREPELEALTRRFRNWIDDLPADAALGTRLAAKFGTSETGSLQDFLAEIADLVGRNRPILIILDQFEELFVHYSNHESLDHYAHELGRIWADALLNVRLLFSMREDWVGSMIVLRRDIPEIFRDTYRLMPLKRDAALRVLTEPLPARGYRWGDGVAQRIVDDLASLRSSADMRQAGRVALEDEQERYADASSLQLLASHLWETRQSSPYPFSRFHYESLQKENEEGAPAEQYINRYLSEALSNDDSVRRLQIDILHQLTDGERHRRASTAAVIERELRKLKRDEGVPVTAPAIQAALQPLADAHIVRDSNITDGIEYELAHDYVVRSVVRLWRELDRLRATEAGRRAKERERTAVRLTQLEKRDETVTTILQIAPAVGIVCLIWTTLALARGDYDAVRFGVAEPGILVYIAFIVLGAVALTTKHQLSILMAAIALVVLQIVTIGISNEQRSVKAIQAAALVSAKTQSDTIDRGMKSVSPSPEEQYPHLGSDLRSVTRTLGDPLDSKQLLQALQEHADKIGKWGAPNDYYILLQTQIRQLASQRSAFLTGRWLGTIILTVTAIVLLLLFLRSAAELQTSDRWASVFEIMWIDLVDLLTFLVPAAAITLVGIRGFEWQLSAVIASVVLPITRLVIAGRFKASPSMLFVQKRIVPLRTNRRPTIAAIQRELLFVPWAALNVVTLGVMWLAVLPACVAIRERTLVDLACGTKVVAAETLPARTAANVLQRGTATA
jgi:hypothetical protein